MKQYIVNRGLIAVGILAAGLFFTNAWVSFNNIQKMYIDTEWVVHTHQVTEAIDKILSLVTVAQAEQRGYIITNDPAYLESYISAPSAISRQFQILENLIADNPQEIDRAKALKTDVADHLKAMEDALYIGRQKNFPYKSAVLDAGNKTMEKVNRQAQEMNTTENEFLIYRTQRFNNVHYRFLLTSLMENFISFILFAAFCFLLRRYLIAQDKATIELARLASIVDYSEDAIIGKNLDDIITSWNKGAEKLFGYTSKEAVNRSIKILIPHDRMSEESRILEKIYKGEHVDHYMTVRQCKDGRLINISLSVSPIKNSQNIIVGVSKIARDITQQCKLEADLKDSQNRFRRLSEDLLKSNKELEQFAFIASHDLKEPLMMIKSFADLLSRRSADKLEKKERDYLDSIKEAALQGHTLIKDLLEFSRIGKEETGVQSVDLEETMESVKTNLKMLIEESDVSIQCNGSLPQVKCSPMEMRQLFQNLIENAIKYRGLETLRITISAEEYKNNRWLFAVGDNGIGISTENRERIFKIFERIHSDSKKSGTGIGLAICSRIVENYGGKIWVESKVGHGSIFYFTLPKNN